MAEMPHEAFGDICPKLVSDELAVSAAVYGPWFQQWPPFSDSPVLISLPRFLSFDFCVFVQVIEKGIRIHEYARAYAYTWETVFHKKAD